VRKAANQAVKDSFGRKVRERRLLLRMSQTDLAIKSEIRQPVISQIERGEANPTVNSILRLANALRIEVSKLFEWRRMFRGGIRALMQFWCSSIYSTPTSLA
jgi:transcriptional regulator with XRE-family HTH domain